MGSCMDTLSEDAVAPIEPPKEVAKPDRRPAYLKLTYVYDDCTGW